MAKITKVEELGVGEDKKVELPDGKTYLLPGDLPVELYLWINRLNSGDPELLEMTELEMVEKLHQEVLELFQQRQPDMQRLPLSVPQLIRLIPKVYGQTAEAGDEGERPPRRSRSGGATQTGRSRQSRTRSRR